MPVRISWLGRALCAAVVCVSLVSVASAVNIETVPVRDAGLGGVGHAFEIGKYEVTAGQYVEFLNAVAGVGDARGLYDGRMFSYDTGCKIQRTGLGTIAQPYIYDVSLDRSDRPVNFVSWMDAARFCNWKTNGEGNGDTETGSYDLANGSYTRESDAVWVIPDYSEWKKAGYYDVVQNLFYNYPTGTSTNGNSAPPALDNGDSMNIMDEGETQYAVGSPYWTSAVGSYLLSVSPYETFDQGGNIQEIMEGGNWRGGSFMKPLRTSQHNYWTVGHAGSNDAYEDKGFRVAVVPEPASIGLLAIGGLALIKRRRR